MILAFNLIVALASICLMWLFVLELTRNRTAAQVSAFALAVNAQFLYWGKSGFETTLLVFFTISAGLMVLRNRLWSASLLLAGAVLTRDDAALLVAVCAFVQFAGDRRNAWKRFLSISLLPVLAFASHTLFRIMYYGDPLPNTYYLKATQLPLTFRISQGAAYIVGAIPSFATAAWIIVAKLRNDIGVASDSHRRVFAALLALLPVYFLYVLWVAGDPFPGTRLFACIWIVPCVAVAIYAAKPDRSMSRLALTGFYFLIVAISPLNLETALLFHAESKYIVSVLRHRHAASYVSPTPSGEPPMSWNALNAWECLAVRNDARLRGLTHASMAVYFAGMAPYFCPEFDAIDLLGKSDATVAREAPHIPGRVGHNKYDYEFSLSHYKPTYILSLIPSAQALDDVEYLYQADDQLNFHHLAQDQEFRLHYRDHALPNTRPAIFIRDDAH
jgi:hypothetical protein